MRQAEVHEQTSERASISSLSEPGLNPYLDLLYRSLEEAGVRVGPRGSLHLRWLVAHRRDVRYLHVNWPESLYRVHGGPSRLRPYTSWVKLALLRVRLRVARALGYRLVWTVHQVYPHGSNARLDRAGSRLLARSADLLLAHDVETAARARAELAPRLETVEVVPHGSYVGVYPPGRERGEVRRELGVPERAVVYLSFGELRANSEVATLLEAFGRLAVDSAALVVAGHAKDRRIGAAVAAAVAADPRIVRIEGFVPVQRVRELYDAADVAVLPRTDGGTSGSLILALSLGLPVVVADTPAYRRLVGDGAAGWLFGPGDALELLAALEAAGRDDASRTERASAARRVAAALDWSEAARQIASLLPK